MLFFTTKVSNNEIEIQETLFQVTRSKSFSLHSKLFLRRVKLLLYRLMRNAFFYNKGFK